MRIFCDTRFSDPADAHLAEGCRGGRLLRSAAATTSNLVPSGIDPRVAEAEIYFGQPSLATLCRADHLRWVHLTSAGYERYTDPEARALLSTRRIRLTTSSSVYAVPCAEHALAAMLTLSRRIDLLLRDQAEARWASDAHRSASGLVSGSQVALLGFGAIGRALAPRLEALGARVVALRRRPHPSDPVPTVTAPDLPDALAAAERVVSLLPGGASTARFVGAQRIGQMKPGAFFYNLGRGTTVDQEALLSGLRDGRLAGAFLDVTDPEPLPPGHPLWTAPRTLISPHTAGGQPAEEAALVRHFLDNLARFERGEALADEVPVDPTTG